MKHLLIILLTVSFDLQAKLPQILSQLECLKSLNSLDDGENQEDKDYFGIEIRNNVGPKSLLLDRKNNEYIIFTEDEVRVCPFSNNLKPGQSVRYLSNLSLKVDATTVAVETEITKTNNGKVVVNSVAFGARENFPANELTSIQCFDKLDEQYRKKLEEYSKHRIEMAKKYCLSQKGPSHEWNDSIDEMFCKDAFSSCAESETLKIYSNKALEELFPMQKNSNQKNLPSAVTEQ